MGVEKKIDILSKIKKNDCFKKKKMISRNFLESLSGHRDSILKIVPHNNNSSLILTGSSDGELRFWSMSFRKNFHIIKAHSRSIKGLSIDHNGKVALTCSDDCTLKLWNISNPGKKPLFFFNSTTPFTSLCSHPKNGFYLTGNRGILLWDQENFKPMQKFGFDSNSVSAIKFNNFEFNLFAAAYSDRSVNLYDMRLQSPIKKILLKMRTNEIIWGKNNCWEFFTANEDGNVYLFDIRNIGKVKKIFTGHSMPVTSVDMGKLHSVLVTGSLDSKLMLFDIARSAKPITYFCQRMKRILSVAMTNDENYFLSGSEDGNLRLWNNYFFDKIYTNKEKKMDYIKKRIKILRIDNRKIVKHKKNLYNNLAKKRSNLLRHSLPGENLKSFGLIKNIF